MYIVLLGDSFCFEALTSYGMMAMEEFQDCRADEGHPHGDQGQENNDGKSDGPKSEKAQKAEIFNQMMNLKTMLGRYTLIKRK